MDKERHILDKMYLETATLAWNGNLVEGLTNIQVINIPHQFFAVFRIQDLVLFLPPGSDIWIRYEHLGSFVGELRNNFLG
jgi:hypothetical protein